MEFLTVTNWLYLVIGMLALILTTSLRILANLNNKNDGWKIITSNISLVMGAFFVIGFVVRTITGVVLDIIK